MDVSQPTLRRLAGCASAEERARAERFQRLRDGGRFLVGRAWRRLLLATQLACEPQDLEFVASETGKPALVGTELRFSAAHSGAIALYATSWSREVGVDVEAIPPMAGLDRFAAKYFSPRERLRLEAIHPTHRAAASLRCWTRKEAYLKGTGLGLTVPLDAVEVWDGAGDCARLPGWSVHDLKIRPGFAAAVAVAEEGDR